MQICRRVRDRVNIYYQSAVKTSLVNTAFEKLQQHSYAFIANQFVGSLVRKVNRFERAFEELADQAVWGLGSTIIQVIVIGVGIYVLDWRFFVAFALWVPMYVLYVTFMVKRKRPKDLAKAEVDSKATGKLADALTNFHTIKFSGSAEIEEKSMREVMLEVREKMRSSWLAGWWLDFGQGIIFATVKVVALSSAVYLWSKGQFTVGGITLVYMYLENISDRLWDLGNQIKKIGESLADANEMTEIMLAPLDIVDKPHARKLKVTQGSIQFDKVTFAYFTDNYVLNNFCLDVKPGEKVALVGPSGGGKSTITKLLLRLYDPNQGTVLIDGQDISAVTQVSLRNNVALVPQEPILFHRSLLENIRYGKPNASEKEVIEAAKSARAHDFISKFENGYQTFVGERGVKLSGGERQRVAIARAILKNAPILVMDEATSALDSESEHLIQLAMKNLMHGKTVIVIAHRLSTIMQMDRIAVIEEGKIVEEGKHAELLKAKNGLYQKLWDIQAGGFSS